MESGLISAYQETDYMAHGNGRVAVVRIGRQSSKSLSLGANERWNRALKRYLIVRGFTFVEGEGRAIDGDWPPEPSIFAFGISRAEASAIGRRYGQNAIVHVSMGRPAELVMLRWLR
jgi:hypothetical protein